MVWPQEALGLARGKNTTHNLLQGWNNLGKATVVGRGPLLFFSMQNQHTLVAFGRAELRGDKLILPEQDFAHVYSRFWCLVFLLRQTQQHITLDSSSVPISNAAQSNTHTHLCRPGVAFPLCFEVRRVGAPSSNAVDHSSPLYSPLPPLFVHAGLLELTAPDNCVLMPPWVCLYWETYRTHIRFAWVLLFGFHFLSVDFRFCFVVVFVVLLSFSFSFHSVLPSVVFFLVSC